MEGKYLGDFSVLETGFSSDGLPVDVGFVSGVLDDAEEKHRLSGGGLLLGLLSHDDD